MYVYHVLIGGKDQLLCCIYGYYNNVVAYLTRAINNYDGDTFFLFNS